jgi:hypothetical protein
MLPQDMRCRPFFQPTFEQSLLVRHARQSLLKVNPMGFKPMGASAASGLIGPS